MLEYSHEASNRKTAFIEEKAMKILVIERTIDQNWGHDNRKDVFQCEESQTMEKYVQAYREKNQIPEEIEFIFVKGSNCGGMMSQWRCYHEESVLDTIRELVSQGEVDGLLLDPILTEEEEISYKYCNNINCELAGEIYHTFKEEIPIAFTVAFTDTSRFESTPLYMEIMQSPRKKSPITPIFHLAGMQVFYERMFQYYIDCMKESQKEPKMKKYS